MFSEIRSRSLARFQNALVVPAITITISWQANDEPDISGYRIYYGDRSRNYHSVIEVGNKTQHVLTDVQEDQPIFFALTAVDTAGNESPFSKEASLFVSEVDQASGLQAYNFPNPFNASTNRTNIHYVLENAASVTIQIFDFHNNLIATIAENVPKTAGEHTEDFWNGQNAFGLRVANGVYFCKIQTETTFEIIKIAVSSY